MATTIPSGDTTGDVYTRSVSPAQLHNSLPVFGSKAFTFLGTLRINSSRPFTFAMTGVLHEPTHGSPFFSPGCPPDSSCRQTSSPVFLFSATRNCRSPGPTHWNTRSPCKTGDDALPQMWICSPRSFRHRSLPLKSRHNRPADPRLAMTRSPSVAQVADPYGLVECVGSLSAK